MVILTQLLEGLKKLAFKKNDPNSISGVPPVRSMNDSPKKATGEKLSFVKITFPKAVTKNFKIFITGDMEAAIKLVVVHEKTLTDLKLEDQVKATRALIGTKKESLADLLKSQDHASRTDKDTLMEAIKELDRSLASL